MEFTNEFAKENPQSVERVSGHQLIYSMFGLLLGFAAIVAGAVLCLNGVLGKTSWTAKVLGVESTLNDAAPGTVLFVVGLFIVLLTRFVVRVGK